MNFANSRSLISKARFYDNDSKNINDFIDQLPNITSIKVDDSIHMKYCNRVV